MLARCTLVGLLGLAACDTTLSSYDEIYSRGGAPFVLCSQNIDNKNSISSDEIGEALMRAKLDDTTLHLYAHRPGDTVEVSTIEDLLAAAVERGVRFTTYEELTAGEVPGSVALSFDDHNLESWVAMLPVLDRYHAQVTFFVSAFPQFSDDERAWVRQLADAGHDIEFHSVAHLNAQTYTRDHGLDAYLADEIVPGLDAMRAAGYGATVFAYPFGARTAETDAALAPYFANIRAIRSTCPHP